MWVQISLPTALSSKYSSADWNNIFVGLWSVQTKPATMVTNPSLVEASVLISTVQFLQLYENAFSQAKCDTEARVLHDATASVQGCISLVVFSIVFLIAGLLSVYLAFASSGHAARRPQIVTIALFLLSSVLQLTAFALFLAKFNAIDGMSCNNVSTTWKVAILWGEGILILSTALTWIGAIAMAFLHGSTVQTSAVQDAQDATMSTKETAVPADSSDTQLSSVNQ